MKNRKVKTMGIGALILLMSVMTSFAQEKKLEGERRHEGMRKEMHEKGPKIPNLTDEQKEQLKAVKIKMQKEMLPLKNELGEKEARLRTLTTTSGSSQKDINKVIDDIGALKTKIMKVKVASKLEMKSHLTEEQQLFLDSHQDKRMHHKRKMKGK